jgi:hypothetical protein
MDPIGASQNKSDLVIVGKKSTTLIIEPANLSINHSARESKEDYYE